MPKLVGYKIYKFVLLYSFLGILAVIMGIIVCFGMGSAMGLFFGPVHSVMPFLLLGIGIDNMFVIVQCYENIKNKKGLDFTQKFGLAMQVRIMSFSFFIPFFFALSLQ